MAAIATCLTAITQCMWRALPILNGAVGWVQGYNIFIPSFHEYSWDLLKGSLSSLHGLQMSWDLHGTRPSSAASELARAHSWQPSPIAPAAPCPQDCSVCQPFFHLLVGLEELQGDSRCNHFCGILRCCILSITGICGSTTAKEKTAWNWR